MKVSSFFSWKQKKQMSDLEHVKGDLLDDKHGADLIVHQVNCLTVREHGLSQSVFEKFPRANCYKSRTAISERNCATEETRDTPGTVTIVDNKVINMFGQYAPGPVGRWSQKYPTYDNRIETQQLRKEWFLACLDDLVAKLRGRKVTIAFPYKIGCGLAGGSWADYSAMLDEFQKKHSETIKVIIVIRECDMPGARKRIWRPQCD
jgi:hypothetical protein